MLIEKGIGSEDSRNWQNIYFCVRRQLQTKVYLRTWGRSLKVCYKFAMSLDQCSINPVCELAELSNTVEAWLEGGTLSHDI